jgi:hypothetical protein
MLIQANMSQITRELRRLNMRMAQQQLEKARRVMPAATAKQAAGNSSS